MIEILQLALLKENILQNFIYPLIASPGVSIDAPFDKSILTVVAADRDNPTTTQVTYRINETAVTGVQSPRYLDLFTIGSDSGVISTNALMSEYKDNYFYLGVLAADPGGLASWALVRVRSIVSRWYPASGGFEEDIWKWLLDDLFGLKHIPA